MSSLEDEVNGIEEELSAIFAFAGKFASIPRIEKANFELKEDNSSEAVLVFPFKKRERVKIIFPYIGIIGTGAQPGILEVIDETTARPVTVYRESFYAQSELTVTHRSFAALQIVDEAGYGESVVQQKYRIKFTPGVHGSTSPLGVRIDRYYEGFREVFDIYGVVI